MNLQFFFDDGPGGSWTQAAKQNFLLNWKSAIKTKWGGRIIKSLSGGGNVKLEFQFVTQIGGWWAFDHWEISVKKIQLGKFSRSSVNPVMGVVSLDSEDLNFVFKGAANGQRGVVYEFGHMLGLPDEYKTGGMSAHSVMHSGEAIFQRHDLYFKQWLDATLKAKGIN